MKPSTGIAVAFSLALTTTAFAAPLALVIADPQPNDGDITRGLAVQYAYPMDVKTLAEAEEALENARDGKPLTGLNYPDAPEGKLALTSRKDTKVAAGISGFMRFDAPGTYTIDFLTNDGLQATLGEQEVAYHDGRHPCETTDKVEVTAPQAGWYALEAVFFQRKGGHCLQMRIGPEGGELDFVDDATFGYID